MSPVNAKNRTTVRYGRSAKMFCVKIFYAVAVAFLVVGLLAVGLQVISAKFNASIYFCKWLTVLTVSTCGRIASVALPSAVNMSPSSGSTINAVNTVKQSPPVYSFGTNFGRLCCIEKTFDLRPLTDLTPTKPVAQNVVYVSVPCNVGTVIPSTVFVIASSVHFATFLLFLVAIVSYRLYLSTCRSRRFQIDVLFTKVLYQLSLHLLYHDI